MAESQDTEITLGAGRLLALFFALVALCAVFFGLGYSAGKNSVKTSAGEAPAPTTASAHVTEPKPTADVANPAPQKNPEAQAPAAQTAPVPTNASTPATSQPETQSETKDPTAAPQTPGYYVQVAAVREQGDADALVDALKKKQYSAFSSAEADKLYHVQIGPFGDLKDAEAMRMKLVSDGYSPILKK